MTKRTFSTPMMQQYAEIKNKYHDCLLFFRLGDFYELFMDDAKVGADELDITLTKRPRGKDGHIPMAGVPYHVADTYIARLVKAGHKVAICEQVSEPDGKGIVERDVVRIVTPGTIMDEKSLNKREYNYTMSISREDTRVGIAVADVSTGEFKTTEAEADNSEAFILQELARFQPKEIILNEVLYSNAVFLKFLTQAKVNVYHFPRWEASTENPEEFLKTHFAVSSLSVFDLLDKPHSQIASAALLSYLQENQRHQLHHFRTIKTYTPEESVLLDSSTIRNLELFETIHDRKKKDTVIHLLDHTQTAMGGRMIREWLKKPLIKRKEISSRHDAVEELSKKNSKRDEIRELLLQVYDIERVASRLAVGIGNPVDLLHLKDSFISALGVHKVSTTLSSSLFKTISKSCRTNIQKVISKIDTTLVDDPPFDSKSGGLIQEGINRSLDRLRNEIADSKVWIAELEKVERKRTGISTLKVRYNKVFGYYIEVSKANSKLVPHDYIRKQTLVNAERYITDELKKHEDKVLSSEEKINELEYRLFNELVSYVISYIDEIHELAEKTATVDVLASYAHVSKLHRYTRPVLHHSQAISIEAGRHPVVETTQERFVSNSFTLGGKSGHIALITGPNMSGKSVFIRQIALITLFAHIGMFVPATKATISIIDRLFVRSGASDVITAGLSTFMLEMVETAYILNHATHNSLIVMDEVGRGTSTYDGISLAWAIVDYLVTTKEMQAKTLFATHYHELTELADTYKGIVKNYSLAVEENNGKPIFLYTLLSTSAPTSLGIEVAELAGLPQTIIRTARGKLKTLEQSHENNTNSPVSIENLDLENMTPREALELLYAMKNEK